MALISKCAPAILVPRDEGHCQPVDEPDLGHESRWRRSNCVSAIVSINVFECVVFHDD
jgi:hypothetical protein